MNTILDDAVATGIKIYLRPVTIEDATEEYLSWLMDEEVTRYLEVGFRENDMQELRSDIIRFNSDRSVKWFAICLLRDDKHIGNIKVERIDWNHKFGEIGFLIGDKSYWGQGIGTEAVALMCEYMFKEYALRRITGGHFDDNEGSRRIFKRNGFEVEGVLKGQRWSRHLKEWVDEWRLAKRNPNL